ncbi:MAG: LysR substrate-binding domain-containing protein [Hyphomicrobiales bacterium]
MTSLLPFEATARLGSITKAGDELGLTQAAVSKQIRALEENLGIALFERRNRAVHLTDAGRMLWQQVARGLEQIADAADTLRQSQKANEIVLRSQLCEGLYWLMPRLSDFYQKHPHIEVRVSISTKPISEAEERFDLALQSTRRAHGSAQCLFTGADEVFPICSPDYLQGKHVPLALDDLDAHRLLHHKPPQQDWTDWDNWLDEIGTETRVGQRGEVYDSYPMMMQAVLEGHGIAIGWARTSAHLLSTGALVCPFDAALKISDSLSLYHPAGRPPGKDTRVLLTWLKEALS